MDGTGLRPLGVSALFGRLGQLFAQECLRGMTEFWAYPCPVEVNGSLVVMRDSTALERFYARRRLGPQEAGLVALEPQIIAVEIPRNGRFRVWLRWRHVFADSAVTEEDVSLYYMTRRPCGALII